jgi:hypothetical protein
VKAVWFRAMALQGLMQIQKQAAEHQLLTLRDFVSSEKELPAEAQPIKIELNDISFRVAAQIPMKWVALGRQKDSTIDIADFLRRVSEAA